MVALEAEVVLVIVVQVLQVQEILLLLALLKEKMVVLVKPRLLVVLVEAELQQLDKMVVKVVEIM
tara:strand:- start:335 stop:529 length:195 start_codon:yes stop_codon:yes gene_type:complete